jgi:hypothetical protein
MSIIRLFFTFDAHFLEIKRNFQILYQSRELERRQRLRLVRHARHVVFVLCFVLPSSFLPPQITPQQKKGREKIYSAVVMTAIHLRKSSANASFTDKSEEKYVQFEFSVASYSYA